MGVGLILRIMQKLFWKNILGDTGEKLFFQPWEIPCILLKSMLIFQGFMIHYQPFFHVSVSRYPQWHTMDWAIAKGVSHLVSSLPSRNHWCWPSQLEVVFKMSFIFKILFFRVKNLLTFTYPCCQYPEPIFQCTGDKV